MGVKSYASWVIPNFLSVSSHSSPVSSLSKAENGLALRAGKLEEVVSIIACVLDHAHRTELLRFADQTWGIRKDGCMVGIW